MPPFAGLFCDFGTQICFQASFFPMWLLPNREYKTPAWIDWPRRFAYPLSLLRWCLWSETRVCQWVILLKCDWLFTKCDWLFTKGHTGWPSVCLPLNRVHRLHLLYHSGNQWCSHFCIAHHCRLVDGLAVDFAVKTAYIFNVVQNNCNCHIVPMAGSVSAGDSQPMDVCSVHHDNSFLRYSVSLLGYGFYGDVLGDSEKKRWLGPARYDLAGTGVEVFLRFNPHARRNLLNQQPQADFRG